MSDLSQAATDYLLLRGALGHKLADAARLLPRFVAYLDEIGAETVTVEAALAWAQQPDATPGSTVWPRRMSVARGFARHLAGSDARTEVPPAGLIPSHQRRRPPFIYAPSDITALMSQARSIRSPLRAATMETLIGLLAVTGMRVGEAIRLEANDVDWAEAVLTIRESKFGKSRHLPLQPSTLDALNAYTRRRGLHHPKPAATTVFVSNVGTPLLYENIWKTFRALIDAAGIGGKSSFPARIHDLRHTFAVRTLIDWYRSGEDVQARLPWLSAYLGHRDPHSTYWYLSAAPELLALAAHRLEAATNPGSPS